jgi:hypothetical protein
MVCPAVAVRQGRRNLCLHAQMPTRQCRLIRNGCPEPAERLTLNRLGKEAAPLPACGRVGHDEESAARPIAGPRLASNSERGQRFPLGKPAASHSVPGLYTANHASSRRSARHPGRAWPSMSHPGLVIFRQGCEMWDP